MTHEEYNTWLAETERSRHHWQSDPIAESQGCHLIYRGGESGHYVSIEGGRLEIGSYEGAIPHIGEACFHPRARKQYESNDEALAQAIQAGGMKFLLDLLGFRCYR